MSVIFAAEDMRDETLLAFHQVWQSCFHEAGDTIPNKNAMTLRKLGALAQHTMLYRLETDTRLDILRSGSTVDDWWGSNMSGMSCADILTPDAFDDTVRFHKKLIVDQCAGYAHEWLSHKSGALLECKSLVFPLTPSSDSIIGHTMSISTITARDFNLCFDGLYQDLVSRKTVEVQYLALTG